MRTRTRIATAVAAGVLATALIAAPSIAATGRSGSATAAQRLGASFQTVASFPAAQAAQPAADCDGSGAAAGAGSRARAGGGQRLAGAGQPGMGRQGTGVQGTRSQGTRSQGAGTQGMATQGTSALAALADVATGTLTDDQKAALAAMADEEKLAHDLYVALADALDAPKFDRIAAAETQHLEQVRLVLDRYEIADPTAGLAAGAFETDSFQDLYDTQLAAGSVSLDAALAAAVLIETTDIADLTAAGVGVNAPDVLQVYSNLLAGSQRHLVAFGG